MTTPAKTLHKRLKRLDRTWYQGRSFVHWSMTIADRRTGWLTPSFHEIFRDTVFHASARHFLCAPVYCLMPDHWHLLWIGLDPRADQLEATAWMRRKVNSALGPFELQDRAFDHVLREKDREKGAFATVAHYILANPVRANLAGDWRDWPYSGTVFPGYPEIDPGKEYFWENFWKAFERQSR